MRTRANTSRLTRLSRPTVNIMKKKQMDQKGAPGMSASPSGYATNASPGPASGSAWYCSFNISTASSRCEAEHGLFLFFSRTAVCTFGGDVPEVNALDVGHVPEHAEDDEARVQRRGRVAQADQDRVSETVNSLCILGTTRLTKKKRQVSVVMVTTCCSDC